MGGEGAGDAAEGVADFFAGQPPAGVGGDDTVDEEAPESRMLDQRPPGGGLRLRVVVLVRRHSGTGKRESIRHSPQCRKERIARGEGARDAVEVREMTQGKVCGKHDGGGGTARNGIGEEGDDVLFRSIAVEIKPGGAEEHLRTVAGGVLVEGERRAGEIG